MKKTPGRKPVEMSITYEDGRVEKSDVFKQLVNVLPDNRDIDNLKVSFSYEPKKKQYWRSDGVNYTREIESNNLRDETKEREEIFLIQGRDKQGRAVVYKDE